LSASILNGSGRFILLDKPAAFPFKDMVTGTPEGPVFDLSVDFDRYDGVGYIKAEHVIEMAHVLGMSTKEETEEMRARISQLEREADSLPENVERLINGIDECISNWRNSSSPVDDPRLNLGIPSDSEESNADNRQGTSEESGNSDKSDEGKADGANSAPIKAGNSPVSKRSDKLSASPIDGFGFDTRD
jgi:hypothetical protein